MIMVVVRFKEVQYLKLTNQKSNSLETEKNIYYDNINSYEGLEAGGQDPCDQPKGETGIFRGSKYLWTFDKKKGACVQFLYGGFAGSENQFKSKGECEKQCLSS